MIPSLTVTRPSTHPSSILLLSFLLHKLQLHLLFQLFFPDLYRWNFLRFVKYSFRHLFQKCCSLVLRYLNLEEQFSSLITSSGSTISSGNALILLPYNKWEGVRTSSISLYSYVSGLELSVDSTSVSRVENSSKDNQALPSAFLKQSLTLATILSKISLHQGALQVKLPLYSLVL